jgi:hypothetical protein
MKFRLERGFDVAVRLIAGDENLVGIVPAEGYRE